MIKSQKIIFENLSIFDKLEMFTVTLFLLFGKSLQFILMVHQLHTICINTPKDNL